MPRLLKAVIGQELTLPCEAYGEPAPQISWFRNGAPVGEGGSLIIREVAHSSAGEYRCVALNSAGQEALEVTLEVLGKCVPWYCFLKISNNNIRQLLSRHRSIQFKTGSFTLMP